MELKLVGPPRDDLALVLGVALHELDARGRELVLGLLERDDLLDLLDENRAQSLEFVLELAARALVLLLCVRQFVEQHRELDEVQDVIRGDARVRELLDRVVELELRVLERLDVLLERLALIGERLGLRSQLVALFEHHLALGLASLERTSRRAAGAAIDIALGLGLGVRRCIALVFVIRGTVRRRRGAIEHEERRRHETRDSIQDSSTPAVLVIGRDLDRIADLERELLLVLCLVVIRCYCRSNLMHASPSTAIA